MTSPNWSTQLRELGDKNEKWLCKWSAHTVYSFTFVENVLHICIIYVLLFVCRYLSVYRQEVIVWLLPYSRTVMIHKQYHWSAWEMNATTTQWMISARVRELTYFDCISCLISFTVDVNYIQIRKSTPVFRKRLFYFSQCMCLKTHLDATICSQTKN